MGKKKMICLGIVLVLFLWVGIGTVDYLRVHNFEKPLFCIGVDLADDGGSGKYIGLGYSFGIKGHFLPEDELPGVTEYSYRIFGIHAEHGIRESA